MKPVEKDVFIDVRLMFTVPNEKGLDELEQLRRAALDAPLTLSPAVAAQDFPFPLIGMEYRGWGLLGEASSHEQQIEETVRRLVELTERLRGLLK